MYCENCCEKRKSLDYLDVLRLVDVSFRLGAIRGDKVFGQIRKIVGDINIEQLRIPYTAVAADLTNQQEIWFQEGCLHQAMRASAAIPSWWALISCRNCRFFGVVAMFKKGKGG